MSTKVEQESTTEPAHVQTTLTTKTSAASASSPKISMFARKSGFVIPKNKLSGSLVPIFKGAHKPGGGDSANDESSKQVQRKTKWGPDLTEDPSVRKGRVMAYKIRLEQITNQLNSGLLEIEDNQDSLLEAQIRNCKSSVPQVKGEKLDQLELEKRETIGEILKLNPSFKAPPDYKPLLKEAKVSVPVKEYPVYNFISLIFGSTGDTQKQLEKKTGAKIRAYGTRMDTGEKVEISPSDGNATHGTYKEVYIHIIADSYEKIDAAVAPIELLITTLSVNPPAVVAPPASAENASGVEPSRFASTSFTVSPILVQPEATQSNLGSAQTQQGGNFQAYPSPWFQPSQPRPPPMGAGFIGQPPFNGSSLFSPRPGQPVGYRPASQNPSFAPPRPQPVSQRPFLPQAPFGQIGAPRNPHGPTFQPPPQPPNVLARPMFAGESPRPLTPSGSTGQRSFSQNPGGMVRMAPPLAPGPHPPTSQPQSGFPPSSSFFPNNHVPPPPTSAPLQQLQMPPQTSPASNAFMRPVPVASPSSVPGGSGPSFTPLNQSPLAAPRPHTSSNDFTFQPQRPPPYMSSSPTQNVWPQIPTGQPPQSQSFQPPLNSNSSSEPGGIRGFPRPPPQLSGNQMNLMQNENRNANAAPLRHHPSFTNPSHVGPGQFSPQLGPRNPPNPGPHMGGHIRGPFLPPRPGPPALLQQNYPGPAASGGGGGGQQRHFLPAPDQQQQQPGGRPGYYNNQGEQQHQTYDPFSPTSAMALQRGNPSRTTKQESDPEYDDLMASVGVK